MLDTFKRIWKFSQNRHNAFVKSLVFAFIRSAFAVTQLFAVLSAIQVVTGELPVKDGIIRIGILTVVCILSNFLTSYIEQINTLTTDFFMVADKRVSIGNILRKIPLGFFNQNSIGSVTATLTTTLSGVEVASTMVMVGIISGLFNAAAIFVFMLIYDYRIGIISALGMVCYLLVVNYQMKVSRKNAPILQKAQTELADNAITFLKGIKVTKAFSFKNGDTRLKEKIEGSCKENISLTTKSMPSQFLAHITIAVFESAILVATLLLYFKGINPSVVKTIVLIIFSFMVYASLNQAGSMLSMIGLLDSGLAEAEKIEETEQLKTEEPIEHPKNNEIQFKNVSFAYEENDILKNISATIEPNTLTAIVGPSGSGKTTLCQLIPRFRDVKEGAITIGGANVKNMPYEELMGKISMVFQNVYLFEDTILNNIKFGKPDATDEEVIEAAKKAQCHSFISNMENGYNTMVEEGGSNLSGGEKQRISIARAILKDSPIIILDEATSALDAENEQEILKAIEELIENKTVIMIAHRLKTVENANQILVLHKGEIVQRGNHNSLIKEDGIYKDFVNARKKAKIWKL